MPLTWPAGRSRTPAHQRKKAEIATQHANPAWTFQTQQSPPSAQGPAPMIAIMEGGKLVVNATLEDRESVEALIHMLTMVKEIAPPKPKRPASEGA